MGANDPNAVIGVYTTASRQTVRMFDPTTGVTTATGPYDQVSRLGSPLVNEVVVPMASKDYFNSQPPVKDSQFAAAVEHPELQNLLPVLYPGAFPNLAAYTKARADLVAIFATGIPGSVIGPAFGVGTYQGGKVIAEMLRLNMGIAPTSSDGTQAGTSNLGLLGNDLAGFPNGRRPTDDVVTIALKAVAGATIPLVDKTYTADKAVSRGQPGRHGEPAVLPGRLPLPGRPARWLLQPADHAGVQPQPGALGGGRGRHGTSPSTTSTTPHPRHRWRRRTSTRGRRTVPPDALVLDIGEDIGALILYAEEACLGRRSI